MNILLVDDSPSLRKVIARYLEPLKDLKIFEAEDGDAAFLVLQEQMLAEDPIRLMILDWMMPKTTGFQLLKDMRNVEAFERTPQIIMLSAETTTEQINACLEYKISTYIIKPFTQQQILDAIQLALGEEKLRHAV